MPQALTQAAETLFLLSVVVAPWAYGGAPDVARHTLAAALLASAALWMASRAAGRRGLPALFLPAMGLPVLAVTQALLGVSVAAVWTFEATLVSAAMAAVMVFWSERARHHSAALRAAGAVLLACAAQATWGAVQWSLASDRIYGQASPVMTTPFGSYVNHNHFAGLVGMGVILSAAMALGYARRAEGVTPRVVALGGLSLALAAAHLASRSRGGLVALGGGLVIMTLAGAATSPGEGASRRRVALAGAAAVAILAFGLAAIPVTTRAHLATLLAGPTDGSSAYRLDIAADTLRLAAARPFMGWGLGAYADAFPSFKRGHGDVRTEHAESDVLEFLAEGGLVGVGLLGWLTWWLWRGLHHRLRHGRDPFRIALALGALSAAAALAIHSLIDFNLRLPANALVFMTLLGLAGAPRDERPPLLQGRAAPAIFAVLSLALAVGAAWRAVGAHAFTGAMAYSAGDRRIAALDRVLHAHPYLPEAWRMRGAAWRDRGWFRSGPGMGLGWAEADLANALDLRPRWAEAWADLAWVQLAGGDPAAAERAFDQASALDPSHNGIRQSRAEFEQRRRQHAMGQPR